MIALLAGCEAPPLDLGPAVLAIHLNNDTDLDDRDLLRLGTGVVALIDIGSAGITPAAAIGGATVQLDTGVGPTAAPELERGLYVTRPEQALDLYGRDALEIDVSRRGVRYGVRTRLSEPLPLDLDVVDAPSGEAVQVPLPEDWTDDHNYVLAQLLSGTGEPLWDNHPAGLEAWLDFLSTPSAATTVRIPARALDEAEVGAVLAVHFLRQVDPGADFHGPINEPVTTVFAGTAWLVPVRKQ